MCCHINALYVFLAGVLLSKSDREVSPFEEKQETDECTECGRAGTLK